ncbi:MAG: hypothetical protein ACLTLQ_15695 [[Clostridium] scindens]
MYKLILKLIKEIYDGTYRRGWEYCIALAIMQENGTRFITFDNGGCFTKDFEEVKADRPSRQIRRGGSHERLRAAE